MPYTKHNVYALTLKGVQILELKFAYFQRKARFKNPIFLCIFKNQLKIIKMIPTVTPIHLKNYFLRKHYFLNFRVSCVFFIIFFPCLNISQTIKMFLLQGLLIHILIFWNKIFNGTNTKISKKFNLCNLSYWISFSFVNILIIKKFLLMFDRRTL